MALFDQLILPLLAREGGFTNDPRDLGGATNFGITQAVARANGYGGDMAAMTRDQAVAIYQSQYWQRPGFAMIAPMAPEIASELFDAGVNMGVSVATTFLQRALNVFNRQQADYPDIPTDGQLGPRTAAALNSFIRARGAAGQKVLLETMKCLRGARYIALAEANMQDEAFVYGWIANRVLNA